MVTCLYIVKIYVTPVYKIEYIDMCPDGGGGGPTYIQLGLTIAVLTFTYLATTLRVESTFCAPSELAFLTGSRLF